MSSDSGGRKARADAIYKPAVRCNLSCPPPPSGPYNSSRVRPFGKYVLLVESCLSYHDFVIEFNDYHVISDLILLIKSKKLINPKKRVNIRKILPIN